MSLISLTLLQKKRVCAEYERRTFASEKPTIEDMRKWAQSAFRLQHPLSRAAMSRILRSRNELLEKADRLIQKRTRNRNGAAHKLEVTLFDWICDQQASRININGPMIKQKGRWLLETINSTLSTREHIKLKFSEGWLNKFKIRWNLRSFRSHGEAGDADTSGIQRELPRIHAILKDYESCDIFNADECGLFYKLAPCTTVATARLPGRKVMKDRITVLPCCNADGSEKIDLMFIGRSAKPRAFKKKSGAELGLDYWANKKAWMTSALFFEWLRRFERYIQRKPNRKVVLLLDNCSAHGRMESLPEMENVRVVFLPPNTTSKVQPMDAGIIASMKVKYRRYQMDRALGLSEEHIRDIYKLDILTAMKAFKGIWNELDSTTIQNCWNHTGILPQSSTREDPMDIRTLLNDDVTEIRFNASQLLPNRSAFGLEQLLNPVGENEGIVQQISDDQMVSNMLGSEANESSEEECEAEESIPLSSVEVLRSLAVVNRFLESEDNPDRSLLRGMGACQRRVRLQRLIESRQTRIEDFF